jgi:hypothetical protein
VTASADRRGSDAATSPCVPPIVGCQWR